MADPNFLTKDAGDAIIIPADHPESKLSQAITYLKKSEIQDVYKAYQFAFACHSDQKRRSGEPYITHPVSVACIAATLHLDAPSIMSALLHDVNHAVKNDLSLHEIELSDLKKFSSVIQKDVYDFLTVKGSVAARSHIGGTNPKQATKAISLAEIQLKKKLR